MEDFDANLDIQEDMKKKKPKKSIVKKPQSVAHETDIGEKNSGPVSLPGTSSPVQDKGTRFCVNCGSEIDKNAIMCPSCGTTTSRMPEEKNRKYCTNCGAKIDIKAEICPKCGVRQLSRRGHESSAGPYAERMAKTINLIEIRPGLFLNVDHIVSVRVLPQEEGNDYAILQLSNGDKLNLTRSEFSTITGEEPRMTARLPQKPLAE